MSREPWKSYFFGIAKKVSERATCPRAHIGCVIVKNHRILVTGYNGSLAGEDHCEDVGCEILDGHCIRTIHAEANAVAQAALIGVSLKGSKAYIFGPRDVCNNCYKLLVAAGVRKIEGVYE